MIGSFAYAGASGQARRAVTIDQVDTAGGDVAIVTLNKPATVRQVKVGGVNCSFFAISSTKIGVITPALTSGSKSLYVKFNSGAAVTSTITYWSPVDSNTTLCLERGDFVGTTWKDRSGNGRDFTSTTLFPVETIREPCFDGVDDVITGTASSVTTASLLGSTGGAGMTYSISVMFRLNSLAADSLGATWTNPGIIVDTGGWIGLHVCDGWLRWLHYGGATAYVTMSPPSLNEWHVVDIECTSGSLIWRIDGGSWSSPVSVTALGSVSDVIKIGANYNETKTLNGDVRVITVSNVARGAAWFDNNLSWFKTRHGYKKDTGRAEVDIVDSDVFDPAGGDVMRMRGRNLTSLSSVLVGTSTHQTIPAISSHPLFDGTNDKLDLVVPRSSLLGGSGWTFTTVVDCRSLAVDGGNFVNQTLFTETSAYMGVEVFKGGARVWQYNTAGTTHYYAIAGGLGNGLHVIQAQWTGTAIRIRIDGGAWASTALAEIGGSGNFKIGSNYNASGAFFKGRIVEMLFSDSVLGDAVTDSLVGGSTNRYGKKFGSIANAPYDAASLSLSAYFKSGNYSAGTWPGTASAGNSNGRDLSEGTNPPTAVTSNSVGIKSFGDMPDFDGVNDVLATALSGTTLLGSGAMSGWILLDADKIVGTGGATAAYTNDIVFGTSPSAYFVMTLKSDGYAQIRAYPVSGVPIEMSILFQGGWNLLQWRCDATNLYFRTNGDEWTSAAFTGIDASGAAASTFTVGAASSYSTNELNARMAEIAFSTTDIGAKGCDDVLAYVNQTYGLGLGGYAPYAFDPTTLSLSLYCKAGNYVAGTWTGTASAGGSSGRNLTEVSNPPSVAANEVTCRMPSVSSGMTTSTIPLFDGDNDTLGGSVEPGVAPTIESVFGLSGGSSSAGSYVILFRANSARTASAVVYENPALLFQHGGNAAGNGCSFSTAGVKFGHYDGTWDTLTIPAAIGEWHAVQVRWDGVNLYARVLTHDRGPGAWQSIVRGPFTTALGGYLDLGGHYANSFSFHGVIAEVMTAAYTMTTTEMDNVVRYLNQRHSMNIGQYGASTYNPSALALTTWFRSGDYSAGTWTGTASTGGSGLVNISRSSGSERPTASTEVVPSLYPITLVNSADVATLTKTIRYANPGTLPSIVWWLRGNDGLTTNATGTVSAWADQSGAGDSNRNVGPTSAAVPFRTSSAYSGKTVIDRQVDVDDRLLRANGVWSTTYGVFTVSAIGHGKTTGNTYFGINDTSMYSCYINSSGTPMMYNLGASESVSATGNLHTPRSTAAAVFHGAQSKFYVEARAAATVTLTNTHTIGAHQGYIGSYVASTTSYGVDALADYIVYSRELSPNEVRVLRRYRDSYYGRATV